MGKKYDSDFVEKVIQLDLGISDEEKALALARKFDREKEFQTAWKQNQQGGLFRRSGKSIFSVLEEVCNSSPAEYTDVLYIESLPDAYKLHNVSVAGVLHSYIWDKELLDQGKGYNQDTWVKKTDKVPSLRDYYFSLASLYEHRNGEQRNLIEEVRQVISIDFTDDRWLMTSTRVSYSTLRKDRVIHNYKSKRENVTRVNVRGRGMELASLKNDPDQLEALFGAANAEEMSAVFEWATGLKPYLHRFEEVPPSHQESVAVITTGYLPGFLNVLIITHAEVHSHEARGLTVEKQ